MKQLFFIIICVTCAQLCLAQKKQEGNDMGLSKKTLTLLNENKKSTQNSDAPKSQKDTLTVGPSKGANTSSAIIYGLPQVERYAHYTMRNGWIEGIGKVTPQQARHMCYYYEFSERNPDGHWGRVRVLNGYGRMDGEYRFQRIFTNLNYEKATWQWDDIPKKTVDVRISKGISDGDLVYHYYDASGIEQCKGYSRKIDDRSVVMHFSTDIGDTIPLYKPNKQYTQCEMIYCERDSEGYDVYQKFFSRQGGVAVNTDSAYAVRRTYDKTGNRLTDRSLDVMDNPVIDYAGNNGWAATYDKRGNELTSTNMDTNWKPIVPKTTDRSSQYIRTHNVYDKYDRLEKTYYTDEKDQPMADGDGLASIIHKYNNRGLLTEFRLYDVKGEPFDGYGYFLCKNEFDDNGYIISRSYYNKDSHTLSDRCYHEVFENDMVGREIRYECYDENGNLRNNSSGVAKRIVSYNLEGEIITKDEWSIDSVGNIVLSYYKHNYPDSIVYYVGDYKTIYLKDSNGNTCEDYRINLIGDTIPTGYLSNRYYRDVYHKINEPHKTIYFRARYDEDNRVIFNQDWDWSESYTYIDSVKHTKHIKEYNSNRQIINNYISNYKNFTDRNYWLYLLNDYDVPCWRTSDNFSYYKKKVSRNFSGNAIMFAFYNEWNEPSYTVRSNKYAYHMICDTGDGTICYDENGQLCEHTDSLFMKLPKAFSIEVTDSIAYRLGICDNDIILKYGDWQHQNDWKNSLDNTFYLETILQASKSKIIWILRSDVKANKTWIDSISLPSGRLSDLGINPILRCMSSKENQRLKDVYTAYLEKTQTSKNNTEDIDLGKNWILLFLPKKNDYTFLYTDMYIRSPFVALMIDFYPKMEDESIGTSNELVLSNQWIMDEERWSNRYSYHINNKHDKINMYYTDNLYSVQYLDSMISFNKFCDAVYTVWMRVPNNIYQKLLSLRGSLRKQGYQIRELANERIEVGSTIKHKIKPLDVISLWSKQPNHTLMDTADVIKMMSKYSKYLDIDSIPLNSKFYGISVDEDTSPELVRDYNELLSKMDMEELQLLYSKISTNGDVYIWKPKNSGKKSFDQIIFYKRDIFIVVKGKFRLLK